MNLFFQPLISEGVHHLDTEESRHCKVLRKKKGDSITVIDGKGFFYEALISDVSSHQCHFEILNSREDRKRNFSIHIAIAPTKNLDRTEWFVEKATELGIETISFLECDHSERTNLKLDRIERIAVSAIKQSLKARLPHINGMTSFESFVSHVEEKQKFIAHVDESNPNQLNHAGIKGESYCVLIGPEGDFSKEELILAKEHGFEKVSLGKSRLRTETAALAACHTLNLLNL